MSEETKNSQPNPYDLSAMRRTASNASPKAPAPLRQPYTLSSSQRLMKAAVIIRKKPF